MTTGIINAGMGNIQSVQNALEFLDFKTKIVNTPHDINDCEKLILPGVGAFSDYMERLHKKNFIEPLNNWACKEKIPILGICLGMQIMAKKGTENVPVDGLGWFEGSVEKLAPHDNSLPIPHVGWNDITFNESELLFKELPDKPDLYFVHSYAITGVPDENIIARCDYGGDFIAAIRKENITAVQFHPEKSQKYGLTILKNFLQ